MMHTASDITRSGRASTLNLNRATYRELVRLPGIGDILARRIIEYREQGGAFHQVEDLVNLGLHQRRLEQIINRLEV